jgi:acid phosphatase type 7
VCGVDVIVNGNDHDYERFAQQDPSGKIDSQHGILEFVVGTGGKNSHRAFGATQPHGEVRQAEAFGVLAYASTRRAATWSALRYAGRYIRRPPIRST